MGFYPTVAEVKAWIAAGNYWPTVQIKRVEWAEKFAA